MKKVLIVTHRIGENYGGIMQAYALQTTLKSLGYDAETTYAPKQSKLVLYLKYVLKAVLHTVRKGISNISPNLQRRITTNTCAFIAKHIRMTPFSAVCNTKKLQQYAAIVVGSDQVWRAKFANIEANGLGFAHDFKGKKLSYAASFGTDTLEEYSQAQRGRFGALLGAFDAISVREASAIGMVRDAWSLSAVQHVDPTLLVSAKQYAALIDTEDTVSSADTVFAYILDKSDAKEAIVDMVSSMLQKNASFFMPPQTTSKTELVKDIASYTLPRVDQWIRGFKDAPYVVTDSFHGCVFAIIFNKPFIAIANSERGTARFTSLLNMFGLPERLVHSTEEVTEQRVKQDINWNAINERIAAERAKSIAYVTTHIGAANE